MHLPVYINEIPRELQIRSRLLHPAVDDYIYKSQNILIRDWRKEQVDRDRRDRTKCYMSNVYEQSVICLYEQEISRTKRNSPTGKLLNLTED